MLFHLLFTFVGCYLATFFVYNFHLGKRLPGPYRWPILGNTVSFIMHGFEKACTGFNKQYGDIVECWLNGEKVLVISDPAIIKYITLKNGENYLQRFTSREVLNASMRGGVGLVFNNNIPNWKFHRRVFKRAVVQMIPHSGPVITKNVQNLVNHWNEMIKKGKDVMDINDFTHKLSLDVIGQLAFGLELNTVSGNFNEISEGIYKGVNAWMESFIFFFLYPSYWKFLPSKTAKGFFADLSNLAHIEKKLFDRSKISATNEESFLRQLSTIVDDELERGYQEEEVLQDIREMLAGGSDTSANTLTYALYFLCHNEHAMNKLNHEVDTQFDANDLECVKKMNHLENVLNEAMRMIPAGPLIFRKAVEDDMLGGFKIIQGTNVILNIWHMMTSEKYWPKPDQFDPDRWLAKDKIIDHSFLPFGEGLRGCPGKPLAMYEMKVILSMLIKNFNFSFVGKELAPWWGLVEHCGKVDMKVTPREDRRE